jgi:FolB domain-containing protein
VDKVIISDLIARGIIGVNDWERERPQDIRINIVAFTDTHNAARTDDLRDCVDYRALAKRVREHAETARRFTVEALANDLAAICLEDQAVVRVIVRVEKPGAVRFSTAVGIEIERGRNASVS